MLPQVEYLGCLVQVVALFLFPQNFFTLLWIVKVVLLMFV
jgi:hypothetical protein